MNMRRYAVVVLLVVTELGVVLLTRWKSIAAQSCSPISRDTGTAQPVSTGPASTQKLAGLEQPVTVIRDTWGDPHIYAQNQHDMFFAQGYATAQDLLFQMELWKRAGQGTLAEILRATFLHRYIGARLLRYHGDMSAEYASYAPDAQQTLKAFTDGINAYIKMISAPGGTRLTPDFKAAGFAPELWKPEDVLTRMAGFPMTRNAVAELAHAELVKLIGAKKASTLYDFNPAVELDPAPGLDLLGLASSLVSNLVGSDVGISFPPLKKAADNFPVEWNSENWGSNNWVVSGKLTQTGRPILSNDPHCTVNIVPSLRYIVHLVSPGWNVIGSTEAGSPGVQGGHNDRVGFGWTILGMDQQDLYVEALDPSDLLRYKTESGWDMMKVEKATFHIKGQADQVVDLIFTRHGPVPWEDAATHRALSLRSVLSDPGTAGYLGCLTMDRVKNWNEFEDTVKIWKAPTHNIVNADIDENIGEHFVGLEPVRKNWTGLMPEPGTGGFEWGNWIPTSELPHQYNPEIGFIASANQKMIPEDYPYKVGYEWTEPDRFNRITELLREAVDHKHKLGIADMERIQNDVTPLPGCALLHLLGDVSGNTEDPATQMLVHWDGAVTRDSAAAALYELWLNGLQEAVMHRMIAATGAADPNAVARIVGNGAVDLVSRHLEHPDIETFGNQPESARKQIMLDTLQAAYARLGQMEGSNSSKWSWGHIHSVVFHHPLETVPEMKSFLDLGPIPRPGDASTINATGGARRGESVFYQTGGPTWRQILDVGAWDNSVMANSPGESGVPGSAHYADLMPLWDQVKYNPMLYSRAAVEQHVSQRLLLEPAK
jgi:penicillin amidase